MRILTTTCEKDSYEPNDDARGQASAIAVGGAAQRHNLCAQGDVDWVQFSVSPGPYVITATSLAPEFDPVIEVYAAGDNPIATNDDYSPDASARIAFTATQPMTYSACNRHYNPAQYGSGTDYDLAISQGSAAAVQTPAIIHSPIEQAPVDTSPAQTVILMCATLCRWWIAPVLWRARPTKALILRRQ